MVNQICFFSRDFDLFLLNGDKEAQNVSQLAFLLYLLIKEDWYLSKFRFFKRATPTSQKS